NDNIASGYLSSAFGFNTFATGDFSVAFGEDATASGAYSFAAGSIAAAGGDRSFAFGSEVNAQSYNSFVIGQRNIPAGTSDSWIETDPLFVIGNGTPMTGLSNALTVLKNGNVGISNTDPSTLLVVGSDATTNVAMTLSGEYQTTGFTNTNTFNFRHGAVDRWRLITSQNSTDSDDFDLTFSAVDNNAVDYNDWMTIKGETGNVRLSAYGAGTLQTDASGNVTASSDERLKNKVGDFSRGLDDLLGVEPIAFQWKQETGFDTEGIYYGFTAQNVRDFI